MPDFEQVRTTLAMSSPFSYHENDNSNNIDSCHSSAKQFFFNPHQFAAIASGTDFIPISAIDPSLAASSIYDTMPASSMAPPLYINPNMASSWPPQDAIYSETCSPTFSANDSSVDPRSLEGFDMLESNSATTLGDESQTSSHLVRSNSASSSLNSTVTAPPPDSPPLKKRRGRRPKSFTTNHASVSSSSPHSATAPQAIAAPPNSNKRRKSIEDAKQVALERNRIAAAKCRFRRNAAETELTTHEREVEDRNYELKANCGALRQEILSLKAEIHNHANCDCNLIQQYLTNEAKRYVTEGGGGEFGSLMSAENTSTN